jgi:predicted transcriptional regulator
MKSVLISIQPKWVEKIASGEKTIEVRKTRPKLETPFKCYIYCTYGKANENYMLGKRGKVIGEFVCRGMMDGGSKLLPKQSCLTLDEILDYAKGKRVYGWRIANLVIYDKPKELSEFRLPCTQKQCASWCKDMKVENAVCLNKGKRFIIRPPQSWCYVEEME